MDPLIRDLPARRIKQRERRLAEPLQLHLHQIVKILSARVEQQQREALPCGVRLIAMCCIASARMLPASAQASPSCIIASSLADRMIVPPMVS